ncbi:MAG: hypothetical protein WAU78_11880 [Roseiarcus sp.]
MSALIRQHLRTATKAVAAITLVVFCCGNAAADELAGRWVDNPKSCVGDRSSSGPNGVNFQIVDFDVRNISFFDDDKCPMTEFTAKSNALYLTTRVFMAYCKGEGGDGPPFWLFISRELNSISVLRVDPKNSEPTNRYSLQRCSNNDDPAEQCTRSLYLALRTMEKEDACGQDHTESVRLKAKFTEDCAGVFQKPQIDQFITQTLKDSRADYRNFGKEKFCR